MNIKIIAVLTLGLALASCTAQKEYEIEGNVTVLRPTATVEAGDPSISFGKTKRIATRATEPIAITGGEMTLNLTDGTTPTVGGGTALYVFNSAGELTLKTGETNIPVAAGQTYRIAVGESFLEAKIADGIPMKLRTEITPTDQRTTQPATDGSASFTLPIKSAGVRLNLVQTPGSKQVESVRLYVDEFDASGSTPTSDKSWNEKAYLDAQTVTPIGDWTQTPGDARKQSAAVLGLLKPGAYGSNTPLAVLTFDDGSRQVMLAPVSLTLTAGQMATYRVHVDGAVVRVEGDFAISDFVPGNGDGETIDGGITYVDGTQPLASQPLFTPTASTWVISGGGTVEVDAAVLANLCKELDKLAEGSLVNLVLSDLTSITTKEIVPGIYGGVFAGYVQLASVELPAVKEIVNYTFRQCSNLTSLSLPEVTKIGSIAFGDCTALTHLELTTEGEIMIDFGPFEGLATSNCDLVLNKDKTWENNTWYDVQWKSITSR